MRAFLDHVITPFKSLKGNASTLIITEPLWAVPVSWVKVYASLYMIELGVTPMEIGLIASVTMVSQIIGGVLGGHVTDKWGRKKTLLIFDFLCWCLPMIIWMLAQNIWYFVVAAVVNGFYLICFPAWNCMLVEETAPEKRAHLFTVLQIVGLGSGLFTPVAGYLVGSYGVEFGTRIIYGLTALSVGAMVLIRAFTLRETSVGLAMSVQAVSGGFSGAIRAYWVSFNRFMKSRTLQILFLLGAINAFYMTAWSAFSAVYMTDPKGLSISPSLVSVVAVVSSIVIIGSLLFLGPFIRPERLKEWLLLSTFCLSLGIFLFIVAPEGTTWVLVASIALSAVGVALFGPVRDTYFANVVGDSERARLVSITSTLGFLVTAPAMPAAGRMYELDPAVPFMLLLALLLISFGAALFLPSSHVEPEGNDVAV